MNEYTLEPANFQDYRDFLKSRFEDLRIKNKNFSIQNCAKRSRISKALLQFLFSKKRHISLEKFTGLAQALKLTKDEEYFVYLMICKNSSGSHSIQSHFESILQRIRHEYVKTAIKEPARSTAAEKSLYIDYHFMALQSIVRLQGFREDPEWISKTLLIPGLTPEKVTTTLDELQKLGYLKRNEAGKLEGKETTLWRPDPYDPSGTKVFSNAAETVASLMQKPEVYKPSVYMSMSLCFDEKSLKDAETFMIEVHHRLVEISKQSASPTALVYFGNFMLTVARLKN